jgi:micrococcal nuclease
MGTESRDHLRSLISQGDGSVMVVAVEQDPYGRTVAELFITPRPDLGYQPEEEIAVNAQMVVDGFAYHYARYSGTCPNGAMLADVEAEAQQARRGVWAEANAVRPWEYRRRQ